MVGQTAGRGAGSQQVGGGGGAGPAQDGVGAEQQHCPGRAHGPTPGPLQVQPPARPVEGHLSWIMKSPKVGIPWTPLCRFKEGMRSTAEASWVQWAVSPSAEAPGPGRKVCV